MHVPAALALSLALTAAQASPVLYQDESSFLAATTTVVDDFESPPWAPDTSYTGPVSAFGATWQAGVELRASSFGPRSGASALADIDAPLADPLDLLEARFDAPHDALGLALRSTGRSDLLVELLAADATVLVAHRQTVVADWMFLGWAGPGLAATGLRVRALRQGGGFTDDFLIDDVRTGGLAVPTGTVPEPGSALLATLALAALRRTARRRRG